MQLEKTQSEELDLSKFPLASTSASTRPMEMEEEEEEEEEEDDDDDGDMSKYDLMAGSDDDAPAARLVNVHLPQTNVFFDELYICEIYTFCTPQYIIIMYTFLLCASF